MFGRFFIAGCAASVSCGLATADQNCERDARPHVEMVYPSADALPENLLRFYIYFSQPMRRDIEADHIRLQTVSDGESVIGTFFQSRYNLWSDDGQRLTLLFDPGRVKSGLESSQANGRALINGEQYRLVVNDDLIGSNGCRLASTFYKAFRVGPADLDIPDPDQWRLDVPRANSFDAVRIALKSVHDHVSLAYRLRVRTDQGEPVAGSIALSGNESEWLFTPQTPWADRDYVVRVHPALEDLAGNRMSGLFDDPTGEARVNESQSNPRLLDFRPTQ